MFNRLRYAYATIRHASSYANAINDHFLDYYLRHHKIIGWHDGKPVYSSFLTPGLSKPLANLLARRLISGLIEQPLPGMTNIAVTDICNARCEHCSFYNAMDKPGEKVLDTEQMTRVIKECQDFGICIINLVGGEPLLRKDLAALVSSIDKEKSVVSIYTNGWFLKEKARELKAAGVMFVNVSLDSADAATHDGFRKKPGLFGRAVAGIKEAQRVGLLTGISTTVTQDDLLNGNFEKVVLLAKELKVNELVVFDTMPIGMYSHREDLSKNKVDKALLFSIVDKYNKQKGFPGIFCYAHFRDISAFNCSAGRNYFYVSPYGEVHPCDWTAKPVGTLLEQSLPQLWFQLVQHKRQHNSTYLNSCCEPGAHDEAPLVHIGGTKHKEM